MEENREDEGPFAKIAPENKETGEQDKKEEISSSRAEELCMGYFKDYAIVKADYAGETNSESMKAYNFFLHDDRGDSFCPDFQAGRQACSLRFI